MTGPAVSPDESPNDVHPLPAPGDDDAALWSALAGLAALPVTTTPQAELLVRVARAAAQAVVGVRHATVTVGDPRAPELLASESQAAQRADRAQLEAGEGPCVDAWSTGRTTVSHDVTHDPRYPRLAVLAGGLSLQAVVGVPVPGRDGATAGVLNLYLAPVPAGVDDDRLPAIAARADLLAAAAAAVVEDGRRLRLLRDETEQLRSALDSRAEIDQAKGILMARSGCDADAAFAQLVGVSRDRNVKLREVARRLVESVVQPPG